MDVVHYLKCASTISKQMKWLIDKLYDIMRMIDQWNALKFVANQLGICLVQNELHMEWEIGNNKKAKT